MKINTNLGNKSEKKHDAIRFAPIERQVYDLLASKLPVEHEFNDGSIAFILNGVRCAYQLEKKHVLLSLIPEVSNKIGDRDYPKVKLGFNKDVTDKMNKFCEIFAKLEDLQKRSEALQAMRPDVKKINEFLNQELSTSFTDVSYWHENISGLPLLFYIKPRGMAPAYGVMMALEDGKLTTFWNGSTARRTPSFARSETLEKAIQQIPTSGSEAMKKKVQIYDELEVKVKAFDPTKNADFVRLLEINKQSNELAAEFYALSDK